MNKELSCDILIKEKNPLDDFLKFWKYIFKYINTGIL
jgi:hypothetical protein